MHTEATLSQDEAAHAERVRSFIAQQIAAADGWMSFERYMDLALYAPGLGYYSAGAQKLGGGGDFTTAPEISALFGACVAQQCAQVMAQLPGASLLEIGAGSGRLAVDILSRLETLDCLPENYFILEVSGDLRDRQRRFIRDRLPRMDGCVVWLDSLPSQPFDGVILANEVLDALPVARFRWGVDHGEELGVAVIDDEFVWAARPAGPHMRRTMNSLAATAGGWSEGYESEYCPRLVPWARAVAQALHRGAVLWFDYGLPRPQYYLAERHDGTLMCHFRQRAHGNPFLYPGLQDITAWVDFTAVAEACIAADCTLGGFTTQAFFLAGLGIDRQMLAMAGGDANLFARLANQARRLMMPGEMGERFKAMAWTRDITGTLSGFALQDLRHSL
jgi:SAM-dependent MidA family methyltransferase